jgi:hypothetical protein
MAGSLAPINATPALTCSSPDHNQALRGLRLIYFIFIMSSSRLSTTALLLGLSVTSGIAAHCYVSRTADSFRLRALQVERQMQALYEPKYQLPSIPSNGLGVGP